MQPVSAKIGRIGEDIGAREFPRQFALRDRAAQIHARHVAHILRELREGIVLGRDLIDGEAGEHVERRCPGTCRGCAGTRPAAPSDPGTASKCRPIARGHRRCRIRYPRISGAIALRRIRVARGIEAIGLDHLGAVPVGNRDDQIPGRRNPIARTSPAGRGHAASTAAAWCRSGRASRNARPGPASFSTIVASKRRPASALAGSPPWLSAVTPSTMAGRVVAVSVVTRWPRAAKTAGEIRETRLRAAERLMVGRVGSEIEIRRIDEAKIQRCRLHLDTRRRVRHARAHLRIGVFQRALAIAVGIE